MEIEYDKLDNEWINNFEKTDKLYQDFYKDDVYYTSLRIIYINRRNEIEKIKEETFLMTTPNTITREEILEILKQNSYDNDRRYTLLSILKYNFTLETEDIKYFLKSYNEYNFLTVVKNIDTIIFDKSINMLQDLNDIIFLFYEKSSELKTKDPSAVTKKIDLNINNKKKTIKKRFKE